MPQIVPISSTRYRDHYTIKINGRKTAFKLKLITTTCILFYFVVIYDSKHFFILPPYSFLTRMRIFGGPLSFFLKDSFMCCVGRLLFSSVWERDVQGSPIPLLIKKRKYLKAVGGLRPAQLAVATPHDLFRVSPGVVLLLTISCCCCTRFLT